MNKINANLLIDELKRQPEIFFSEGRTYDLLQEYFGGENVDSLIKLLSHRSLAVRKSAIWIVSELGENAIPIVESVLPLLKDDERYVKYHALESVMVCSSSGVRNIFHHITSALEDDDFVIRKLGMFLISNASAPQLEEANQYYSKAMDKFHIEGLELLTSNMAYVSQVDQFNSQLYTENGSLAMYRAICLRRYVQNTGREVSFELDQVKDDATRAFLAEL